MGWMIDPVTFGLPCQTCGKITEKTLASLKRQSIHNCRCGGELEVNMDVQRSILMCLTEDARDLAKDFGDP